MIMNIELSDFNSLMRAYVC